MKFILFLSLGVIFWTFLEYNIHRFFGHRRKGNNIIKSEHLRHHREAHYFAPMYLKSIMAIIVIGTVGVISYFMLPGWGAFGFTTGLTLMYLLYEITHRVYHVRGPLIRYGLKMRKHHFYHHFKNPKVNHGVTVAFWDRVFGTFEPTRKEPIPVPKRLAMPWLIDQQNNSVRSDYERHFQMK